MISLAFGCWQAAIRDYIDGLLPSNKSMRDAALENVDGRVPVGVMDLVSTIYLLEG